MVVPYNAKETMEVLIKAKLTIIDLHDDHEPLKKAKLIRDILIRAKKKFKKEKDDEEDLDDDDVTLKNDYDSYRDHQNDYFLFYFGYSDLLYLDTCIPYVDKLIERYNDMIEMLSKYKNEDSLSDIN